MHTRTTQQNNKAATYLEGTKEKFEKGENTQKELQQINELKGLNRAQKKELSSQMSDNFIKSAAENNQGRITPTAIAQQVVNHANEHKLSKEQGSKLYHDTLARFEQHKNMQNITSGGHVMKDAFANMQIKQEQDPNKQAQTPNKADDMIKQAKKEFSKGSSVLDQTQHISNMRGLSSEQKQELDNLRSDNFIKNAAENNGGIVDSKSLNQQIAQHAKTHKLDKQEQQQMQDMASARLDKHKDMQNITNNGQVMKDAFANMNIKAKTQTAKSKPKTSAPANVQGHTQSVGKHITSANNAQQSKAQPQQSKPQNSQSSLQANANQSQGRGR